MHELSVAEGLADAALEAAAGRRVEALTISVGLFSGVYADSLAFYLQLLFEDRGLAAPRLDLKSPPARCRCECGLEHGLERAMDPCPSCGGHRRKVLEGRDCLLLSMEVAS
jgi:hydrogenase nickel incorporation protein HypA/HybF